MEIDHMTSPQFDPAPAQGSANVGPARRGSRARQLGLAGAAVGLGLLAAGSLNGYDRAFAQLKPDASADATASRAPLSFADVIERVKPSVVSISVVAGGNKVASKDGEKDGRGLPEGFPDIPEDSPFYEFFKNLPKDFRGPQQQRPQQAQGSGFVVTEDGYVVTNNHVIDGASKIQVSFDDQEKLDADLIGTDARTDLALLKIKSTGKTFPAIKFATGQPRVGDWAIAVGNPFGLGGTVTAGIVSALGRDIGSGPYDFLQIDAAVNRGNSGGPTFNLAGEVIGVNTAIYSPSGGNVGIAFAVPAKTAMEVIEQLKSTGSVSRGWLGVKIQNVDDDTAAALGLPNAKGALVSDLTPDGPAEASGLKPQDAILQVNKDTIADSRDLARKIAEYAPDTTVDVKVWRNNGEQLVKVKLGKFPGSSEPLGLTLAPTKTAGPGATEGVTISEVDGESDAAEKGLKAGDVILEVAGEPISSPADVVTRVDKAKSMGRTAIMLSVKGQDQKRYVPVQLKKG
jgi:serine protease Do